jgi:uncharacterized protein (TIGR03086 family)
MPSDDAMGQVMARPQLGRSPVEDFAATAAAQRLAFGAPGRLEQPVSHPLGEMPAGRFLELRVFDLAVHAWDLARAVGGDEVLDPPLVEAVLEVVEGRSDGMGFGITPLGRAGVDATAQRRLLDLAGRRP